MRLQKHIIFILVVAIFSVSNIYAQSGSDKTTTKHTVGIGETVYSLATKYQTTVEAINNLNPGAKNGIKSGQVLIIPQTDISSSDNGATVPYLFKHTIQPQETLFSVSQKYKITVGELRKANPGLDENSFSIGREIIIPDVYAEARKRNAAISHISDDAGYRVQKHDTLYSISKRFGCSTEDIIKLNPEIHESGLREGAIIKIPGGAVSQSVTSGYDSSLYISTQEFDHLPSAYIPQDGVVRIALLLPFIQGSKNVSLAKITEYYEGFLLAVQRMKEKGLNAEIYTFDIGADNDTKRLKSILETYELSSVDLIIGGVSDKQIQLLSRFSQKNGTNYVVPFSSKNTGVEYNPHIFQVANSHASQYPRIAKAFVKTFDKCNVIFMTEDGSDKNRMDFVKQLQKELKDAKLNYKVAPTTLSITSDLNSVIDKSKKNIIIPTSSSENSLRRILAGLGTLKRENVDFSLFGYPEWQTYINHRNALHQFNTYLYSMFYLDDKEPEALLFADRYKKWYNKSLIVSFPKFAHMGYDTGTLFMTALQKKGRDFASSLNSFKIPTLQSALYFESVRGKGGYINTGIYFVNLKPDGSVEKKEISK